MKKIDWHYFILVLITILGCNNPNKDNTTILMNNDSLIEEATTTKPIEIKVIEKDTLPTIEKMAVNNWSIEDFIISPSKNYSEDLKQYIKYEKEQWKNTPNPLIVNYKGNDIGDYFHLTFEDNKGNSYDFGFGNNNFGDYELYNKTDLTDNPKYLNKTFKVYWEWKPSKFPCCSGEYKIVEAYLPSIAKLELIN